MKLNWSSFFILFVWYADNEYRASHRHMPGIWRIGGGGKTQIRKPKRKSVHDFVEGGAKAHFRFPGEVRRGAGGDENRRGTVRRKVMKCSKETTNTIR